MAIFPRLGHVQYVHPSGAVEPLTSPEFNAEPPPVQNLAGLDPPERADEQEPLDSSVDEPVAVASIAMGPDSFEIPQLAALRPQPLAPPPNLEVFAGETLKAVVTRWAKTTDRSIVWKADIDYTIAADHRFDSSDLVTAFAVLMRQFPRLCGLPYANALVVSNAKHSGVCHAQN